MPNLIGERLKARKEATGTTVQSLSELSGVPVSSINRIFSGETQNPNFQTVYDLARALGCTVDELMGDAKPADPPPQRTAEPVATADAIQAIERAYQSQVKFAHKLLGWALIAAAALMAFIIGILIFDLFHGGIGYIRY